MELGLLYYNARFYVPGLGRFASADTIVPNPASPQSFNRYSYVENSPVIFRDPTGHCKNGRGSGPGTCQVDDMEPGFADGSLIQTGDNVPQILTKSELGTVGTIASFVPYLDTGDDIATALTGCGYACQAGSEEPVGWGWRGVSAVGIFAPFGGSMIRHGADEAVGWLSHFGDDIVEAADGVRLLSARNWRNAEDVLGDFLGLPKNTERYFVEGMSTYRIPDFIGDGFIADSKFYGASALNVSPQLEDFVTLARDQEVPLYIFVRDGTHVSGNAQELIRATGGDIIRIFEGP